MGIATRVLYSPRSVHEMLLARRRKRYRGVKLDATAQLMLAMWEVSRTPPIHELEPAAARAQLKSMGVPFEVAEAPCRTEDTTLGGVPARVYRGGRDDAPAMLFFHGGGFVVGSIDSYDRVCRYIANKAEATVVSVEYGLAPEHPFPEGHEDANRAFDAAIAGELSIRPPRWMVAGDSAGGNLSANVAHHARDTGAPLAYQYLVYPATNLTHDTTSYRELKERNLLLSKELMEWFAMHFARTNVGDNPKASPAHRADHKGLAPATVITAGFDPLSDEARDYVDTLRTAGVAVDHRHYPTMIHGFMNFGGIMPDAVVLLDDMAAKLRNL